MIHGDMPDGAAWIAMAGPVGAGIFNGAWQRQIEHQFIGRTMKTSHFIYNLYGIICQNGR